MENGLTLQPGCPRISGDGDSKEYSYTFWCEKGTAESYIPMKHSANSYGGNGYFVRHSITSNAAYDILELTFSDIVPETGMDAIKEGKNQPSLRTSLIEKPLNSHVNYYVCWDHYLECKEADKAVTLPSGWDTAKLKDPMVGNTQFRWKHKSESVANGYVQRTAVKKPELETYLYPSAEISEKYYYRRAKDAETKVRSTGRKDTPSKTFGITAEWLNLGSELSQEGKYWVCSVAYSGAVEWDDDVYAEA